MNEDPQVPNYDLVQRIIRSPFSGSKGPLSSARFADVRYNLEYEHTTLGPDWLLPEKWYEDEAKRQEVHRRFDSVVMQGGGGKPGNGAGQCGAQRDGQRKSPWPVVGRVLRLDRDR